jgi:tetratricopeptide (TPR) repeat protein
LWAVQSYVQTVGVDHLDTAFSQSILASIYIHQGQYTQAEALLWEVIQCCERLGQGDHPYLAHCLSNLATIYYKQGNYARAEPLVQRALLIGKHARSLYNPYMRQRYRQ